MSMRDNNHMLTICEVLRLINDRIQGKDAMSAEIRDMLALCEYMAKKMAKKLHDYNKEWNADWWGNNAEYDKELTRREQTYQIGDPLAAGRALKKLTEVGKCLIFSLSSLTLATSDMLILL